MASHPSSTRSPEEGSQDRASSTSDAERAAELLDELRPRLLERAPASSKTSYAKVIDEVLKRLRSAPAATEPPDRATDSVARLRSAIAELAEERGRPLVGPLGRALHLALDEVEVGSELAREPGQRAEGGFFEGFLRSLAHDLRNPISAIRLAASILTRDKQAADARRRTVQRISSNTDRLLRTLEDSLDYARLVNGGGLRLELASADIEAVCRAAIAALELAYPSRRLVFESTGSIQSTCDKDRLGRALSNLIVAALENSAPESETRVRLETGNEIGITIANARLEVDPGGIAAPFGRSFEPQTLRPGEHPRGLGLGLGVARAVVMAHGGSLRLENDDPEGIMFVVTLPAAGPVTAPSE